MKLRLVSHSALPLAVLGLIVVGLVSGLAPSPALAAAGTNPQINFQGRLLNNAGAVVADGNYNMRFKIYCDGDGVLGGSDPGSCTAHASNEHLLWTETRQNSASAGVAVKNGYFSVQLGSVSSLSGVDFNQSVLWLSMDITTNGTDTGGSPTYNGEMTPFKRLTSSVYAMNASQLQGLSASAFAQLGANQTFTGTNAFSNAVTANNNLTVTAGATVLNGAVAGSGTAVAVGTGAASNVGLSVQGASSQTADLLQLKDSGGSNLLKVDSAANIESLGYLSSPYGGVGPYGNLLVNSEQLDSSGGTPPWTTGGTLTVTPDNTTAPDGQASADRLAGTGSTTLSQTLTTSTAGTYTFSVWLKQSSGAATSGLCIFAAGGATPSSCSATAVTPNSTTWQRFSVTTTVSGTTTSVTVRILPGNGSTATIYAWGAQLVLASTPQVYTRTGTTTTPQNLGVVANGSFQINATNGQTTDLLRVVDGAGNFAVKVFPSGTIANYTKPTTNAATGSLELGSSATQSSNDINGVIGFPGSGVQNAQIAYAVGDGFYLCNSSASSASGDYGQCASRVNLYGALGHFNNGLTVSSGTLTVSGLSTNGAVYVSSGALNSETNLNVTRGGTGIGTTTAYGLLTGGTTATGVFQNAGTGSSGNILKSNGNAALPTWVANTAANACSDCLVQAPASTAQNTITPTVASVVGLTVNATSSTAAVSLDVNQTQAASGVTIDVSNGSGTAPAGAAVAKTGAGTLTSAVDISNATGTTTNGLNINNSSGTMTNGISFAGTIGTDIKRTTGTLTLQGASTSIQTAAAGTITIGDTNNSAITTGTGLLTQGGSITFSGTTARTITGPGTGGLTMTVASGPLTLSTTTSGALAVTSVGTLGLTGTITTIKPTTDISNALQVQNAAGSVSALTVDTETSTNPMKVQVGDTSTANAPVLFVVDTEDADPTGTDGAMYYNSTAATFRCYEDGFWTDCIQNGRSTFHAYTDFPVNPMNSSDGDYDPWFDTSTAMASGSTDYHANFGEPGHPYIMMLQTGTNATGGVWYASRHAGALFATTEKWTFSTQVRVSALSSGTQTYTARLGFVDDASSNTDPGNGCYFKYIHSGSSGHWQGVCSNLSINSGTCDTGVTPVISGSGWDELRLEVTSEAKFYVNDTLGCTISTANMIPTAIGHNFGFGATIYKSVGTTNRSIDVDYMEVVGRLGSRR